MESRILIAHDGSTVSDDAVALVVGASWPYGTVVRVVTVVPELPGLRAHRDEAEDLVRKVAERLTDREFAVEAAVLQGRPAAAILEDARRFEATLVVVGSTGLGALASTLLGSVSREVVDDAPCPVLVARGPRASRILYATDASNGAQIAERALVELPFADAAEVRVLSVAEIVRPWSAGIAPTMHGPVYEWQAAYEAEAREIHAAIAGEAAARLVERGIVADHAVRLGGGAVEVTAEAREWGADLVVLGSRGRRGLRRFVLGSVVRSVLSDAGCSVLVVREMARTRPRDERRADESTLVSA